MSTVPESGRGTVENWAAYRAADRATWSPEARAIWEARHAAELAGVPYTNPDGDAEASQLLAALRADLETEAARQCVHPALLNAALS